MTTPPAYPYPGYWGQPPPPPPPPRRRGVTVLLFAVPIVLTIGLIAAMIFAGLHTVRNVAQTARTADVTHADWQPFVDAGATTAKNLTTIDYRTAERDVQRVLDNSTGSFHSDFAARSDDFIETIRTAQSVSTGTVESAGIESLDAGAARVLAAVKVETEKAGSPSSEPRVWRLRLTVVEAEFGFKTSDVKFVS